MTINMLEAFKNIVVLFIICIRPYYIYSHPLAFSSLSHPIKNILSDRYLLPDYCRHNLVNSCQLNNSIMTLLTACLFLTHVFHTLWQPLSLLMCHFH